MLADSGADASLISASFVQLHNIPVFTYPMSLRFDVANNQPVICEHYVKVQLRINSFCCMCLLTVMPDLVHAYDVLLGADWLTVQGALVDYVDKTLTLRTPQANPKALVTAKQAARWLRKGGSAMVAMVSLEDLALPVDAVSHVQRQHLQDLLDEYSDVFQPITGLPPERAVGHSIPLQPDGKPPARPSYRMSKPEQEELRKQITDLLAKGLIEPSSSPYAAPVLFVQKKSGELRMCIDYRQLNKITIRDQYPLPRIDDLFDQLAGKTVFSSLDLQAGYHQIRIPAEDVPKTAFRTPMGHYQFKVLCFGLTNAPATFQRVMNEAFAEVINDCALVYLDDILVMSKDSEEHLVHLRRVFDLLRKNKFYAKLSKCEFMQRTLKFLGHIISAHGISVDPCKVTAISEWPVPTSLKTLQSFLGAANYVRKFVHNFSTIAAPLTNLTGPKKECFPWKAWPQAELDAFNALKQAISNVPMLKLPDHSKPFQVHCDASLEGIGAVLMQDGYPLAYYSRKLIPAEINYTTGEQELLALVSACQQWRCYLEGVPFTLKSADSMFQVGDRVLLSTMNLRNMVGKARKLLPRVLTSDCEVEEEDCETEDCGDDMSIGQFNLLPPIDIATARLAAARINGEDAEEDAVLRAFIKAPKFADLATRSKAAASTQAKDKSQLKTSYQMPPGTASPRMGGSATQIFCASASLPLPVLCVVNIKISENDMAPILQPDDLMDFMGRFALMWKVVDGHVKAAFKAGERAAIITEEDLVKALPHMDPATPQGCLNRVLYVLATGVFMRGDELVNLELHHLERMPPDEENEEEVYKIKDIACKNWQGPGSWPMSGHAAAAPAAYEGPPPTPGPGSWPMSGHAAAAPAGYGGPPPTPGPGSWPMSGHAAAAPAAYGGPPPTPGPGSWQGVWYPGHGIMGSRTLHLAVRLASSCACGWSH
ncbi:hypothetical protein QJQ45_012292 [Haematococcus lacustris]|nr:hypothetical protein QJQ45_012292 [Haematococcus lacustris]